MVVITVQYVYTAAAAVHVYVMCASIVYCVWQVTEWNRLWQVELFLLYFACDCVYVLDLNLLSELRVTMSDAVCLPLQVWDGVSNRCISVFPKAHAGAEVCGVVGVLCVSFGTVCCVPCTCKAANHTHQHATCGQ